MFIRSKAKTRILKSNPPSTSVNLTFDEACSICDEEQPNDKNVIRHETTDNIICISCLEQIAEMV
jgi:hypothetical protein